MDFRLDVDHLSGFSVIKVTGEVDICTSKVLDDRVKELLGEGRRRFAFDLRDCPYFDSEGIKVLIRALRGVGVDGVVAICAPNGLVRKTLEISGMDTYFPMFDSFMDFCAYIEDKQCNTLL